MIENATGQSPGFRNEKNRLVTTRGVTEKIGHVGGLRDQPGQPPESGRAANRQRRPVLARVDRQGIGDPFRDEVEHAYGVRPQCRRLPMARALA